MAWGSGKQICRTCGQPISHLSDYLPACELRGPRNINPSDIDRIFDDGGRRFLVIEEKRPDEKRASRGQLLMLQHLARQPAFTVWLARGTPDLLTIEDLGSPKPWPLLQDIGFPDYERAVWEWFDADGQVAS